MPKFLDRFVGKRDRGKDPIAALPDVDVPSLTVVDGQQEGPDAAERRKWPRMSLVLQARIRFASRSAAIHSSTFDISPGGVFLQLDEPRPVGTPVRLTLEVGARTMVLAGAVAWVAEGPHPHRGVGIAFTEISADDEQFLQALLEARDGR